MKKFPALGEFVRYLESIGELKRVPFEVDSALEVTEVAVRALKLGKPALLFERVKGSPFPLAINVYASERRIELALGRHPRQIGEELIGFAERLMPPKPSALWRERAMMRRLLKARPVMSSWGTSQAVTMPPNLDMLPVQVCWPLDGGRFFTQPQIITHDPEDGKRNTGMYRMQVFDRETTGMHIQIERGAGFHYAKAERLGRPLEAAVALGTDPAYMLATVASLPEGIDEILFAAFLRGEPFPMVKARTLSIPVPAHAEFIIEGVIPSAERRIEGPFGDHFGHYSHAAPFPVFKVRTITHRHNPVYPATVVGIPPMEDKWVGDATQEMLAPLVRLIHREIKDVWAYYEAGFHNLLVVSVDERYHKEAMKAALGLLGTGQLSLSKTVVLVSEGVNVRDWSAVLREIKEYFNPHYDFVLLNKVPMDTLDFTSFTMELGSKMILDATRKQKREETRQRRKDAEARKPLNLKTLDRRILDAVLIDDAMLVVKTAGEGRKLLERLLKRQQLQHLKIIAVVSEDVDIHSQEQYLWGVFTRYDCERDVLFSEQELYGIAPVYRGVMGIDATYKKGYPERLVMPGELVRKVDERWDQYWK